MSETVPKAQAWAQKNEAMLLEHMLSCYKAQESEFINQDFLIKVEAALQNKSSPYNAQETLPTKISMSF